MKRHAHHFRNRSPKPCVLKEKALDHVRPVRQGRRGIDGGTIPAYDADFFDPVLFNLVMLRLAQIHDVPVAAELHREVLKKEGEKDERLEQLRMWRASPLFDDREKTALAWGETIALHRQRQIMGPVLEVVKRHFTREQIVSLTLAILSGTDWNYR